MITAPSGTLSSMSTPVGSACADAPPPLVAGGPATAAAPAASSVQSPLQVTMGGGAAALTGAAALAPVAASSAITAPAPAFAPIATTTVLPVAPATVGGAAAAPTDVAAPTTATGTATPVAASATPATTTTATPTRMTTLAPGAAQTDADLVEATLANLRRSPSGAQLVDRLLAVGARINVISDDEFTAMGHGDAHAFYDPSVDAMFMRRSDLSGTNKDFAAVALAHEGTHLLDDVAGLSEPYVAEANRKMVAAGGTTTAAGMQVFESAKFELMMIKEARAFTFAGQVARDLGVQTPASDPTSVASAGANDDATYGRVWQALLASPYNPDGRSIPARNF